MRCFLSVVFIAFLCSISRGEEPTTFRATDLALHYCVIHWETRASLAPGTFRVSLAEIVDGKIGNNLVGAKTSLASDPEGQRIVVMADNNQPGTIISAVLGSGVLINNREAKDRPTITFFQSSPLPKTIGEGTFVLGGAYYPRDGKVTATGKVEDVKHGLLLRILPQPVK